MLHRHRWPTSTALDDLFLRHYPALVVRAQQLLGRDRQAAEDLVHDVYVRLALRQFDLGAVDNVEGYLAATLRNVHLSQVRRRLANVAATVSILDYESVVSGLRSVTSDEERHAAYDALRDVIRYACLRKPTSKAASVLILRFFHGYYPGEIARVVQTTETAVAGRLRVARAEARVYLADPGRVRAFDARRIVIPDSPPGDDTASVRALRQAIFDECTGACVSTRALDHLYASRVSDPLDVTTLAHVVSCALCLDTINQRLGLPRLADRDPADSLGRGGPGSGGGGTADASLASVLRTRVKDARDDRPQALQIAVNGLFVGSQAVAGRMNEQRLRILMPEQVGFIEVFDEYDTCLLYLDVEPPPHGPVEQSAHVALSDGRALFATVAFTDASPTVHVVYDNVAPPVATPNLTTGRREPMTPDAVPLPRRWGLWPVPLRFVLAGIVMGALLANPRQTLAAVEQVRRAIVDSIAQLIEHVRPRRVLPSHIVMRPADVFPFAAPATRIGPDEPVRPASAEGIPSDITLSEVALNALRALDGVDALTREQIDVQPGADARLHIAGVVDTEARRQQLIAVLRALPPRRLRLDIVTIDDAARRQQTASPAATDRLHVAELRRDQEPAAYDDVRRSVVARDADTPAGQVAADAVGEAVREVSGAVLAHALQARIQARTVRDLAGRVTSAEARRLSPGAQAAWRDLVCRHAELVRQETAALRQAIAAIFPLPAAGEAGQLPATEGDVWQMAARLFELASAHDSAVSHAFAVVAAGSESLAAGTPAFRQSLLDAERLADALLAAMPGASNP